MVSYTPTVVVVVQYTVVSVAKSVKTWVVNKIQPLLVDDNRGEMGRSIVTTGRMATLQ